MRTRDDAKQRDWPWFVLSRRAMMRVFSVQFGSRIYFVDWYNTLKMGMGFIQKIVQVNVTFYVCDNSPRLIFLPSEF